MITKFYDLYHLQAKLQKEVIGEKNFTYREIISVLKKLRGIHSVLDIGCGVGTIDFYMSYRLNKRVDGIDVSRQAIKMARKNAGLFNIRKKPKFVQLSFPDRFPASRYDFIICSETIEHITNDKRAVKRMNELLNKNGFLLITTPSKNAPLYRLGFLKKFDSDVGHLRRYSAEELKKLVESFGFETIEVIKKEGIFRNFLFTFSLGGLFVKLANRFYFFSDIFTFFDNLFLRIFGESSILLLARKK